MDLITEHASVDSADGYGPETRYLINTMGDILKTYVTELVIKRPADPIDYLARSLKHHAEMEQIISAELMLEVDEQQPNPSESTEPSSLSIEISHPGFVKAELQDHTPEEILAEKIMQETAEDEVKPDDTEESNENVVHLVKDDVESSGQNEVDELGEIASNGEDTDTIGEMKVDTSNALQDNTEVTMDETMVADSLDFDDVQPYASEMVDPDEEIPEGSENDAGNVDTNA